MFGLTDDEVAFLLGALSSLWGLQMARGNRYDTNKLASIMDKIRRGVQTAEDLKSAIDYESKNLDESSFETDGQYEWARGHADGLSDALRIIEGENWKEVVDYEQ